MPVNAWRLALASWIGLIFFSSTSLASEWCENSFTYFIGSLFQRQSHSASYDLIHLLADKGLHVTLFSVLAIVLWQAVPKMPRKLFFVLLCGAIVGSCSEFLQRFFPDRDPAIRDVFINIGGTALGLLIYFAVKRRNPELQDRGV